MFNPMQTDYYRFCKAVRKGNKLAAQNLILNDAVLNILKERNETLLHVAVNKASVEMTKNLIKHGANINILDENHKTALKRAWTTISHYQRELDQYIYNWGKNFGYEDCCANIIRNKKIIEILQIHVVKLCVAKLEVNNGNFNYLIPCQHFIENELEQTIDIKHFEKQCVKEVEQLKTEFIDTISFYDLLTRRNYFPMRFVKNEEVEKTLNNEIWNTKFPLYIDIIRNRFQKIKIQKRLQNPAKIFFRNHISKELPNECIDMIFSNFNIEELSMFVRSYKTIDKKRKKK
ncbi:uncharacterized protein [Chelonus insularis]|uniref:uncharacterized protein n=1 Tax=Chelonus insularis TaxID=460826 RepID=UPI001589AF2D|nr:uncharacterized protein LOC118070124 [Chelonus insularis]